MSRKSADAPSSSRNPVNAPRYQHAPEIQSYGSLAPVMLDIGDNEREASVADLNQVLADTITLRDLYKKHHWQVSGATFYALHLLYDKHAAEQSELIDALAERVQLLGGVAVAMAADVAETTAIPRPPRGRETVPTQLTRLVEAHRQIIETARDAAHDAADRSDDGTDDLLISEIVRTNELQVWFVAEHLVATPLFAEHHDRAAE